MSRQTIPLVIEDMSAFARALAGQLAGEGAGEAAVPSHLALLNMLARAAGWRNYQHLRAIAGGGAVAPAPAVEAAPEFDPRRMLVHFDAQGRLIRWPSRRSQQVLALWALWARLPAGVSMTERQVSDRLRDLHLFGDNAILRRDMVEIRLMSRNPDGTDYRRVEQAPPGEALALIRALAGRG